MAALVVYFGHMEGKMRSLAEEVRAAKELTGEHERTLLEARRAYLEARDAAEAALVAAGNLEGISQDEHDDLARKTAGLLLGELLEADLNGERSSFAERLRALADTVADDRPMRATRGRGDRAVAMEQIEAANALLRDVSDARWGTIEACRELVDLSADLDAARECCALLEADMALCSAIGDAERAARASAALRAIQEQIRRLEPEEQENEDGPRAVARAVVASLRTERQVPSGDELWFQEEIARWLTENVKTGDIWDRVADAVRAAKSRYAEIQRRAGPPPRSRDLKQELLGDKARF